MKSKSCSSEKVNKTYKLPARKRKREKTQITNINNKGRNISTLVAGIKRVTIKYYKHLYTHK